MTDVGSPDQPGYTAGWSVLLDPDACPTRYLPYLGQFIGVYVPPNTPDAQARAIIRAEAGFSRGSPQSIVTAAKSWLSGTKSVQLIERQSPSGPDPYHFILIVRPEEVIDAAQLTNAVNAVKPVGLQWTPLVETDGETWAQAGRAWSADTTTWAQKG